MKKYLICIVLLLSITNKIYSANITTFVDSCDYIVIKNVTLQSVFCHKDFCLTQKTPTKVHLVFNSPNYPFTFTFDSLQCLQMGFTLNGLHSHISNILKSRCTTTSIPPTPNAGDSLIAKKIDSLILYTKKLDTTHVDTSLVQRIQLQQIIDSLSTLIGKSINDTTHTYILNEISNLISKLDTSNIDTSLVAQIDYTLKFDSVLIKLNELVLKVVDTTQVDTSLINYIAQLDSIIYYLKNQSPADTITHKYLDSILHRQDTICLPSILQVNDSLVASKLDSLIFYTKKLDTTQVDTSLINYIAQFERQNDTLSAILNKLDTTRIAILTEIKDSIGSLIIATKKNNDSLQLALIIDSLTQTNIILSKIENLLKKDCIGSNETYYINGTNNIFLNSSEVCSYTVTVIDGEVSYTENGVTSPFNLPTGYTGTTSFKNGANYLINSVSFTGVSGLSKAIIKVIK